MSETSRNNELINRMLELTEEHMNEGDYIDSAKLLKTLHEKEGTEKTTYQFEHPIQILKDGEGDDDDEEMLFEIIGFISKEREHRTMIVKDNSNTELVFHYKCCSQFENFIKLQLQVNFAFDIVIKHSILGLKHYMFGKDNIQYQRNLYNALDETDEDDCHMEYKLVERQVNTIEKIVRLTCDMIKNDKPYV